MKVLVTGAGALLGQGIIRSLTELAGTKDYEIVATDPSRESAGLYWADRGCLVPMASEENYTTELCRIIDKLRPDVIIPGTDVELPKLAEARDAIEARFSTHLIVSSPEVVRVADDKLLTSRFFSSKGIPAPISCMPSEAKALVENIGFPLIVKPRVGARSVGVYRVDSLQELEYAISRNSNPVVQECVGDDGHEYTAGTICFDGKCRAVIVMRRDLRDGNTYRSHVVADPSLVEQVTRFAEALDAYGPANFQFRVDRDGVAKVFEINARFSGTTPLRARAGFNEVDMCIRYLTEAQPVLQPSLKAVSFLRHWSETVVTSAQMDAIDSTCSTF